ILSYLDLFYSIDTVKFKHLFVILIFSKVMCDPLFSPVNSSILMSEGIEVDESYDLFLNKGDCQ
ncbi:unnamed protein product, partial [Nezara viridula]